MSLSPGSRIGPYEVVGLLGAGGMGEVFRAHDARLRRDVALKVLTPAAAGDADRRLRFEREAQVLASLNHPNIAQIFGVESSGGAPVLVMELVEGPTLADRLGQGAVLLDAALGIAAQICEGLDAAHERGIVHRDLKPANIKLLQSGSVKILDFGLARVLEDDRRHDVANSPTVLGGRTEVGVILGTAAYMSPEQARAIEVDKRTDIWSFGCILYEMLAGAPAFSGPSTTDILADVVRSEPDWARLPAGTSAAVVDLLKRCLRKNPRERWRDIGDVRLQLLQAQRASSPSAAHRPTTARPRASALPPLAWFAAGAAIAAAGGLAIGLLSVEEVPLPEPVRTTIALPRDLTLALGRGSAIALSPDGRTLVFAGRSADRTQLYLRRLDSFEIQPLPGTDNATNPFFSRDGRWVAFFADEKIKKVALDGGAPVIVGDALNPRGEAWAADDTIFVTPLNSAGVSSVPAVGGKLEPYTTLRQGELSHRWPRMLPDGVALLFSIWNDDGWEGSRIAVKRRGDADHTVVVQASGGYPRYVRDAGTTGFLVYARSEGLLGARFDESSLAIGGQPVPLLDGVITNLSGGAHFDLSSSGTLAYVPGALAEGDREVVWVTREGKPVGNPIKIRGLTQTWRLSPDGTKITRNDVGGRGDIWVEDLATRQSTRVTTQRELGNFSPVWSADGRSIVFARGLSNTDLFARPSDGRNAETQITGRARPQAPMSVSRDGEWLLFSDLDPVTGFDIWVAPLRGKGDPRPFLKTGVNDSVARFSPDGRWVAYQSNESGRFEVFIRSFPDGARVLRVSTDGGVAPEWSPVRNELFYRTLNTNIMMVVGVGDGTGLTPGTPRRLFDASAYDNVFAVSPDGSRLLVMPLIAAGQSATQVNVVQNFLTELRQRVQ